MIRAKAAHALGRIGSASEPSVTKLIQLFDDQDLVVQQRAISAVGQIGVVAIPDLLDELRQSKKTPVNVYYAFAEIGIDAVPELLVSITRR
jgi:HEAT repeat protein